MIYRILLVDDDPLVTQAIKYQLEGWGYQVESASTGADALLKVRESKLGGEYAVILLDYHLPDQDGASVLEAIHSLCAEAIVLCHSGDLSRGVLKSALRAGALDFIEKGNDSESLKETLDKFCKQFEVTVRVAKVGTSNTNNEELIASIGMIGRSQKLAEVAKQVLKYRSSSKPVLILGETGTGKELVARAFHTGREDKYLAVNCASYSGDKDLLESELFGHEKGSFTGANVRKVGIFEAARGGTVFLDELHHLSGSAQARLLRAVQEKKVRRVGATHEFDMDFRLIAASKPDLQARVIRKEFLEDLYFRINYSKIIVPALRDRPEDIEPLVLYFSKKFGDEHGAQKKFLVSTVRRLEGYMWPGNVRELEAYVYQLCIESTGDTIRVEQLDERFAEKVAKSEMSDSGEIISTLAFLEKKYDEERRSLIVGTLRATPSLGMAAKRLGVAKTTLHSLLLRLGLRRAKAVEGGDLQVSTEGACL